MRSRCHSMRGPRHGGIWFWLVRPQCSQQWLHGAQQLYTADHLCLQSANLGMQLANCRLLLIATCSKLGVARSKPGDMSFCGRQPLLGGGLGLVSLVPLALLLLCLFCGRRSRLRRRWLGHRGGGRRFLELRCLDIVEPPAVKVVGVQRVGLGRRKLLQVHNTPPTRTCSSSEAVQA